MAYDISIVMPALNEQTALEQAVRDVVDAFAHTRLHGEVIIVNDGSTDQTGAIAERLSHEFAHVQVIHHDTPKGVGTSYWDGIERAKGELVSWLPGDGEANPRELLKLVPLADRVDVVIPFVIDDTSRAPSRRLLSRLYSSIMRTTTGLGLRYFNGGTVYRRCVLEGITLESHGFFFQAELLFRVIRQGYLYVEAPYVIGTRAAGRSRALRPRAVAALLAEYTRFALRIAELGRDAPPVHPRSRTAAWHSEATRRATAAAS